MEAKVIQMKFNIVEVSLINNLHPLHFINFVNSNHSNMLIGDKIEARNITKVIKAFKRSNKNLIQKIFNL